MHYFSLACLSAIFFIILDILYKYTDCSKLPAELFVSLWYIAGGTISLIYFLTKEFYKKSIKMNNLFLIIFIAILTFSGNIVYFNSARQSPNPGLSRALFSGSLILGLTLISFLFFKGKLDIIKFLGILFIVIGISCIVIKD
tara:strand:+ start:2545 stop:2970 length:426 start_codon:yes stop_codon:yes gene_type:complete